MSPLEIPLEVGKEMEIAWRQVGAVGWMGENLKLPVSTCVAPI